MHRVADLEHKVQLQVQDQSKLQESFEASTLHIGLQQQQQANAMDEHHTRLMGRLALLECRLAVMENTMCEVQFQSQEEQPPRQSASQPLIKALFSVQEQPPRQSASQPLIKALSVKTSIALDALGLGLQKDALYIQSLENAETCVASKDQLKTHIEAVAELRQSSDSTEASTADAAEVEQYGVMERLAVNVIEKVTEIAQLRADLEEEIRSRCYQDAQILARNVTELAEIRAWSVKELGRLQAEWQATETIRHDAQKEVWHDHCFKMQATVD
jgi:hypothetical protein